MITFFEFIARRHGVDPIGTPEEMLARAGIWPSVPHEAVIKRMLKRWMKQALVPARPNPHRMPPAGRGGQPSGRSVFPSGDTLAT
jgi:hypothetical protein